MTGLLRCHWCGETHDPGALVPGQEDGQQVMRCPVLVAGGPQVEWRPEWQAEMEAQIASAFAGGVYLTAADLATVLDALDVAADYKRDRVANCPDCDASPTDLCDTCEHWLAVADAYDALTRRLEGNQ